MMPTSGTLRASSGSYKGFPGSGVDFSGPPSTILVQQERQMVEVAISQLFFLI